MSKKATALKTVPASPAPVNNAKTEPDLHVLDVFRGEAMQILGAELEYRLGEGDYDGEGYFVPTNEERMLLYVLTQSARGRGEDAGSLALEKWAAAMEEMATRIRAAVKEREEPKAA